MCDHETPLVVPGRGTHPGLVRLADRRALRLEAQTEVVERFRVLELSRPFDRVHPERRERSAGDVLDQSSKLLRREPAWAGELPIGLAHHVVQTLRAAGPTPDRDVEEKGNHCALG